MKLILPTVSTSKSYGTNAQVWAANQNYNFFKSDSHNHTANNGNRISCNNLTSGNLDLNQFTIYDVNYVGLNNLSSLSGLSDASLYVYGENLWFLDGSGNHVQITDGSSLVSVTTTSGFFGDYTTANASSVYFSDTDSFYFYGNDSSTLANIQCAGVYTGLFGKTSITVQDLTYSVTNFTTDIVTTLEGYFPNAINSCPDPVTGLWQNCFYSLEQTGFSYPYVARTDSYGGTAIPNITLIPFYGESGMGFYNYANDTTSQSPYLFFEIYLNEQIETNLFETDTWKLLSYSSTNFTVSRSFTLNADYSSNTTYSTKKLLNIDAIITYNSQTASSGTIVQNMPYNATTSTIFFAPSTDTDGNTTTIVTVTVTIPETTGSIYGNTNGYRFEQSSTLTSYYVQNSTYNTYHSLFIVVKGLVRGFL